MDSVTGDLPDMIGGVLQMSSDGVALSIDRLCGDGHCVEEGLNLWFQSWKEYEEKSRLEIGTILENGFSMDYKKFTYYTGIGCSKLGAGSFGRILGN